MTNAQVYNKKEAVDAASFLLNDEKVIPASFDCAQDRLWRE